MKWLVAYAVRVNGFLTIRNVILPEALPPMNWITIANRENKRDNDPLVNKEYALINYWHVSDYDAKKWKDDGTVYLTTSISGKELK
jgi:hypothetical protein